MFIAPVANITKHDDTTGVDVEFEPEAWSGETADNSFSTYGYGCKLYDSTVEEFGTSVYRENNLRVGVRDCIRVYVSTSIGGRCEYYGPGRIVAGKLDWNPVGDEENIKIWCR